MSVTTTITQLKPSPVTVKLAPPPPLKNEPSNEETLNIIIEDLLNGRILNNEEKELLQNWVKSFNLKIFDAHIDEKGKKVATLALSDLICVIINPALKRTNNPDLKDVKDLVLDILTTVLSGKESVESTIEAYEMILLEQKTSEERVKKVIDVANGTLKEFGLTLEGMDVRNQEVFEKIKSRLIKLIEDKKMECIDLKKILTDLTEAHNGNEASLLALSTKSKICGEKLNLFQQETLKLKKECENVLK